MTQKTIFSPITENEDVYEGEWLNGKREGAGIYYYKSKEKIYDGEWVNDIPKCGVYTAADEFFEESSPINDDPTEIPRFVRKAIPIPAVVFMFCLHF